MTETVPAETNPAPGPRRPTRTEDRRRRPARTVGGDDGGGGGHRRRDVGWRPRFAGLGLAAAGACLIALGLALPLGCAREPSRPASQPAAAGAPDGSVVVSLGGKPFTLEVAATPESQQLGLMYRKSMPADAGMVFVFPGEQHLGFWMKNTEIPLDILYLDADGRIVSVKQMAPRDETRVPSGGPAKYAIELNQGTAARLGLKAGDRIDLPDRVRNPPELKPSPPVPSGGDAR